MSVRPFSPSERFSFPKPPQADEDLVRSFSLIVHVQTFRKEVNTHAAADANAGPSYRVSSCSVSEPLNPFDDANSSSGHSGSSHSTASTHQPHGERIRRPFVPTLGDEVAVSTGDIVDVQQVFDDGWAYVAVQREASEPSVGLIPVDCFREAGEELPAFLAAKRVSSYKGPVQAQ
ncbi:hypothetical protein BDV98DRAFT_502392 [Pterulicium gracile]|uniref:SH3 domain-containing protein n=1 Tax=Pterulicium gracile TaxID=1884261 RepID=A0A5C3QT67_9AGAR|nr:hypothetical protein BDV98DRAFT_502392 [Pterula gracilis]